MNHEFHPEALAEFEDAARYYEGKQAGLGQHFISSVESSIQNLTSHPLAYAVIEQDIRRCLTHVFPYAVLYTVEPDYILIVAIMHCRQKPGYWRNRLGV